MEPKRIAADYSPDAVEWAMMQQENETLAQQVKSLIKAEGKLYAYQEQLDEQLKEYKDIYDLNKKFHSTIDIRKIFSYTCEFVINNLGYERAVLFQQMEGDENFSVSALDGYYDEEEKQDVTEFVISMKDPRLKPLFAGAEFLICNAGVEQANLEVFRDKLLMQEFLVYLVGPETLLVVGNSAAESSFYKRVEVGENSLLSTGNLVGLLTSALENYAFYANMEKALEQERVTEAKYRGIFENAIEGIFQTTPGGQFISCNPATAAILGYDSPEDLIEHVTDIKHQLYVNPLYREQLFELIQKNVEVKNFEVEFYRKNGSIQWVLLSARPYLSETGEILYLDGIMQDISERKHAEMALQLLNEELEQRVIDRTKELESTNSELRQVTKELENAFSDLKSAHSRILQQEKMASIGQLAAGVAHEINNPMGFIISNLSSLRKYVDKLTGFIHLQAETIRNFAFSVGADKVTDDLKTREKSLKLDYVMKDVGNLIEESLDGAERVKKIVSELKSFSRIDESSVKSADINEGLESTINIVWNELKYKATVTREYGKIPQTTCNLGQLNQVFMNILVNAAQAIETKGEIVINTSCDDKNIYIRIGDTGKGIAEDKLNRIFEPFFTTKDVGKGTGLGLSIAYDIIKKHNGEIQVESEVGKGTIFRIKIPIVE